MVQNGPKMTPQMSQMCPKWGQNGPHGPKMIKKGPWEGARAPKDEKGLQKGGPRREKIPPLGDKKRSKSIKKRVWKHDGFQVALWIDFGVHFAHQHGTQKGE